MKLLAVSVMTFLVVVSTVFATETDIPLRWEAAARKMITTIMANPPESVFLATTEELRYVRPFINELLHDFDENKKADMVEDLMEALTKAIMKRSRIPLKHRLSNAAIGVVVDYMGKVPSKNKLTPEMMDRAKTYVEALMADCKADKKCKRFVPN